MSQKNTRGTKTYLGRLLIAIDQLGNALSGGNEDVTISARLGYLNLTRDIWFVKVLVFVVDTTFFPVDGPGHCEQAIIKEVSRDIHRGSDLALAVMGLLVIPSCILLLWPVFIYSLFVK